MSDFRDLINKFSKDAVEAPEKLKCVPSKIFLCGGVITSLKVKKSTSARDYTYKYLNENHNLLFQKIILAEEVKDWFEIDKIYDDLLEMEKDLAGLVATVPLFLEGPGAIAELGAFTQLPEIFEKLSVIMTQHHYNNKSFIKLGPIRYMEKNGRGQNILRFMWTNNKNGTFNAQTFEPHVKKITRKIETFVAEAKRDRVFELKKNAHKILLACDLVNMFQICTINEIRLAFKNMSFEVTKKKLKGYLKMAENLKLVSHVDDGGDDDSLYFIPDALHQEDYVAYKFKSGLAEGDNDKLRWKSRFKVIVDKNQERKAKVQHLLSQSGGVL